MNQNILKIGKKVFEHDILKHIGYVFSGQLLFQGFGLLISFMLVRNLPKQDYAVFTILMSIQGMITVLSGSGVTIGFQKIAGENWDNDRALSILIKTAYRLRLKIFILAFFVANGYGFFILYKQGCSLLLCLAYLACISLAVFPELQKLFIRIILLLRKKVAVVQFTGLIEQSIRLTLLAIVILFFKSYLSIWVVLAISIIGPWVSNIYIERKSKEIIHKVDEVDEGYNKTLLRYLKLNWHNSFFYTFKGQVSIFLIGVLGTSNDLASLGAITRFTMVFTIVSSITTSLIVPAFAKLQDEAKMKKFYIFSFVGWILFSSVVMLLAWLLDDFLLSILGSGYKGLNDEFLLVFLSGCIGQGVVLFQGLNYSKGWMQHNTYFSIPLDLISYAICIYFLNVSRISGVLFLGMITTGVSILLIFANTINGFKFYNKKTIV